MIRGKNQQDDYVIISENNHLFLSPTFLTMATEFCKIRKSYLQLSKAKLTRQCHKMNLDAYGSKAELVDILMREHRKATLNRQTPSSSQSARQSNAPKSPTKRVSKSFVHPVSRVNGKKLKKLSHRSQSHDVDAFPATSTPKKKWRKQRSKSIDMTGPAVSELTDRRKRQSVNGNMPTPKSRRRRDSTPSMTSSHRKRDLLKMSKPELMRRCRIHRVDINGARTRSDIVERLWSVEKLFQEKAERQSTSKRFVAAKNTKTTPSATLKIRVKKRRKKKENGLLFRSKSEDRYPNGPLQSHQSKKRNKPNNRRRPDPMESIEKQSLQTLDDGALSEGGLSPLEDEQEVDLNGNAINVHDDGVAPGLESVNGHQESQEMALWLDSSCDFAECVARRHVIDALARYSEFGENEGAIANIMEMYPHLLSDWHHILWIHLNGNMVDNARCFEALYEDVQRQHLLCDLEECCHYIRYNRDREKESVGSDADLDDELTIDLLDSMHTQLVWYITCCVPHIVYRILYIA